MKIDEAPRDSFDNFCSSLAHRPKPKPRAGRIFLVCLECGKKFSRSSSAYDVECPKCHSTDIEVA